MGFLTGLGDLLKTGLSVASVIPGAHQVITQSVSSAIRASEAARGVGEFRPTGGLTAAATPSGTGLLPGTMPGLPGFMPPVGLPIPPAPSQTLTIPQDHQLMQNQNGFQDSISALIGGDRIVMAPQQRIVHSAPPGWVIVDMPDGTGKRAVRKEVAKCLGLWKPRPKPPITASEWKQLRTARRVEKKAKRIATAANFTCTPRKTRR